jgi:hypothetical protein
MKNKPEIEDNLCTEYDLKSLRIRKLGSERKSFGGSTAESDATKPSNPNP